MCQRRIEAAGKAEASAISVKSFSSESKAAEMLEKNHFLHFKLLFLVYLQLQGSI